VLFLFEQFKECSQDNLYHSIKFSRQASVGGKCDMEHGVTRKSGRGLPSSVFQEEI
jgi:hypothetical protein